jgi:hypothetical protein
MVNARADDSMFRILPARRNEPRGGLDAGQMFIISMHGVLSRKVKRAGRMFNLCTLFKSNFFAQRLTKIAFWAG